jgi:hypothetical protein
LPITNLTLTQKNIKIISARSVYGEEYPGDYGRWKIEGFKSIVNKINTAVTIHFYLGSDQYYLYRRFKY